VVTLGQSHNNALYAFAGWSGGTCVGTGACNVTVNAVTNVIATFNRRLAPPVRCRVPNVVGKKLGAARALIASKRCRVGTVTRIKSSNNKKGRVISQSRAPGKVLPKGSKVNLRVGKGP
jgi:beta-lactam-binding protein with PASTA domain